VSAPCAAAAGVGHVSYGPVAVGAGHVVAVRNNGFENATRSVVEDRDVRTGKIRILATDALPSVGIASTSRWVVFGIPGPQRSVLVAVQHGGGRRVVLARSLLTAIAARGDTVAWAEAVGNRQRIVVRTMSTGRNWVAADLPTCERGRCYRLDFVTLADAGVVFSRGAIGSFPSLVERRRFGGPLERTQVVNDPQPDLVSSYAGAYYYAYGRGWMRWDFGRVRPVRGAETPTGDVVLGLERIGLILRTASACHPAVLVRQGARTRSFRQAAAPSPFGPTCAILSAFAVDSRTIALAWALLPLASLQGSNDLGLVGLLRVDVV
jgi:hypothetical protein